MVQMNLSDAEFKRRVKAYHKRHKYEIDSKYMQRIDPNRLTLTEKWNWGVILSSDGFFRERLWLTFYEEPPLKSAHSSRRILITGTHSEVVEIDENNRLRAEILEGLNCDRVDYSSNIGFFWKRFFGKEDFVSGLEGRTIPMAMITTGRMRVYYMSGSCTENVLERQEEIAKMWDIPLHVIETPLPKLYRHKIIN